MREGGGFLLVTEEQETKKGTLRVTPAFHVGEHKNFWTWRKTIDRGAGKKEME